MTQPDHTVPIEGDSPAPDTAPGRRRTDPRLPAYLVAGIGALIASIATGRPDLAALGAPLLALAAAGLNRWEPALPRGEVRLHQGQGLEGDSVEGEVHLDWKGEAQMDVILAGGRGVTALEPDSVTGWSLKSGCGPVTLPFTLRADSWGVHDLGTLWVRVRRPGSLVVREHRLATAPSLRVLPTEQRLNRLLRLAEPHTVSGMHLSRLRGHGTDFAELRQYQPGDRLRDISWSASARQGTPWVTVHHPERTGTVVILLDSVFSGEERSTEALARAARAAWTVASVHLRAQDRVGFLAQGRTAAWLPPRGGRRARVTLLDQLLAVGQAAEAQSRPQLQCGRVVVPPDALVVGVSSLRSQTFTRGLLRFKRIGHTVAALVIDTSDLFPRTRDSIDGAARRVYLAQRDLQRRSLERSGVPCTLVTANAGVGLAILSLRRKLNAMYKPSRSGVLR